MRSRHAPAASPRTGTEPFGSGMRTRTVGVSRRLPLIVRPRKELRIAKTATLQSWFSPRMRRRSADQAARSGPGASAAVAARGWSGGHDADRWICPPLLCLWAAS